MKKNGKEQFYEELEKFVVTRLRAFPKLHSYEAGKIGKMRKKDNCGWTLHGQNIKCWIYHEEMLNIRI